MAGYKVPKGINEVPFSIRVNQENYNIIVELSKKSKKSYNFIINSMIQYAIENMDKSEINNLNIKKRKK